MTWTYHDWGRHQYLDGAAMQCLVIDGKYPSGNIIAFCKDLSAARLFAAAPDTKTALEDMIDLVIWMSGATDFAPEGKAHKGWLNAQKRITAANAAIASATGEA